MWCVTLFHIKPEHPFAINMNLPLLATFITRWWQPHDIRWWVAAALICGITPYAGTQHLCTSEGQPVVSFLLEQTAHCSN